MVASSVWVVVAAPVMLEEIPDGRTALVNYSSELIDDLERHPLPGMLAVT